MGQPLECKLDCDRVLINEDLFIAFHRTIRVPDNGQTLDLPPSLGIFPLKPMSQYATKLAPAMAAKGGLFLPMYRGVNAISGEPALEDAATKLRRITRLSGSLHAYSPTPEPLSPLQDYIVVPDQSWIDGIADSNGTVRQFVAMPFDSGYSVESQITGQDSTGDIQFEVTPYREYVAPSYQPLAPMPEPCSFYVDVKYVSGKYLRFRPSSQTQEIGRLMSLACEKEGLRPFKYVFCYGLDRLNPSDTFESHDIQKGDVIEVHDAQFGGCGPVLEMSIAAGGKISQVIHADQNGDEWLSDRTTVFNVQILNSKAYKAVTGQRPPSKPLSARTYKKHGFPFFAVYEEPSGISGDFNTVNSVAEIDGIKEEEVELDVVQLGSDRSKHPYDSNGPPIGIACPNSPLRDFRTVRDLEKQYSRFHVASF